MENSVKWGSEIRKGSGFSALAGQGGSGWGSKQDHRPEVEVAGEILPGHGGAKWLSAGVATRGSPSSGQGRKAGELAPKFHLSTEAQKASMQTERGVAQV